MKKHFCLVYSALAITLAGCSDDMTETVTTPVQTGEEINFGTSISKENNKNAGIDSKGIDLKTTYGPRTQTGIPVLWEQNDDVAIFCPQASAPANKLVTYLITPDKEYPNTSAHITKENIDKAGLQWGTENEHKFYALYPASRLKNATSDEVQGHGILTANIPELQNPVEWVRTIDPTTRDSAFYAIPDMNNAYMWAHTHVLKDTLNTGSAIPLKFQNLVTVLDITLPGPESPNDEVTISNINIESTNKNDLMTGDFKFYIKDGESEPQGTCEPAPSNGNEVRHRISISGWDPVKKNYIKLKGPNQKLVVKAYIVPDNRQQAKTDRELKIKVVMNNGSMRSKTLTTPVVAQKVNRILLPRIEKGEPAKWMSELDDRIYLTELSIPGSKMSYLTQENGANPAYQTKTISEQFNDGVRAFIVQTGCKTNYSETRTNVGSNWWPKWEYTYKLKNATLPIEGSNGKELEHTIKDIAAGLEQAKNEFAVVVLTCTGSACKAQYDQQRGPGVKEGWPRWWIDGVKARLQELANIPANRIYTGEITPNTTLGDVRGKIIIKVNYNDEVQQKYMNANDGVPAMYAIWKNPNSDPNLTPESTLTWGTLNSNTSRAKMRWVCMEATHVGNNAEITVVDKKRGILNMFEKGIEIYNSTSYNAWLMNDIGGVYTNTNNHSTMDLARDMNLIAVESLQERKKNASTGLVFMNFADRDPKSGGKVKSDWIIQTIIDNNFKFQLRRKQ